MKKQITKQENKELPVGKVYAYLRVSTGRQTVESQKIGVQELAREKKLTISKYVVDEGVSGKVDINARKLGKLLKRMKPGDILICSELSRLSRTMLSLMKVLETCLNREIKIYTVKEHYCLGDNLEAKILAFAFSLVAEIERNLIRDRTIEGLARAKANGVKLGRKPNTVLEKRKLDKFENRIKKYLADGISQLKMCRRLKCSPKTLRKYLIDKFNYSPKTVLTEALNDDNVESVNSSLHTTKVTN